MASWLAPALTARTFLLGRRSMDFRDSHRERRVRMEIWYPAGRGLPRAVESSAWVRRPEVRDAPVVAGRHPLVLLSHGHHGTLGDPSSLIWLTDRLVAAGYVVVAPWHRDPHKGNVHIEHWHRPLDISAALDEVLNSPLANSIDASRVGFVGYSLGGATGLWLAGARAQHYRRTIDPGTRYIPPHPRTAERERYIDYLRQSTDFEAAARSYRDGRISNFFLLAPALGWAFSDSSLAAIDRPVSIVVGDRDEFLVPATNALHFAAKIPGARCRVFKGADHGVFLSRIAPETVRKRPELRELAQDPPGVSREAVHRVVGKLLIEFLRRP